MTGRLNLLFRSLCACALLLAGLGRGGAWAAGPAAPLFTTRTVTSPANSGAGSLRQALAAAAPGDVITFSASVFPPGNPTTIYVLSALPALAAAGLTLDASQAGVIIDGSRAPANTSGLTLSGSNLTVQGLTLRRFANAGILLLPGASNNLIGGDRTSGLGPNGQGNLIVYNGGSGVEIRGPGSHDNQVRGNYIGIDPTGWWEWGNGLNGVAIIAGASNNTVGGTASGYRNVISGNAQNGIWIDGSGTTTNTVSGNYLGTRADGLGEVGNHWSGISLQNGAQNNVVGGTVAGAGNLISGNRRDGVWVSDAGTTGNSLLGNYIGTDWLGTGIIGQVASGVVITNGAQYTLVGSPAARNLISGNGLDGVFIAGDLTGHNTVQGNYFSTNISGTAALPNGMHGVDLSIGTHDNQVGGNRLAGEGNLMSGDGNHGLVIALGAHHNTVQGNIVGPDATGSYFLGHHPYGGIDVTSGAYANTLGGLGAGQGNLISGNLMDGVAIYDAPANSVLGNLIGVTLDGAHALPNHGPGLFVFSGAYSTLVEGNTLSGNLEDGLRLDSAGVYSCSVSSNFIGTSPDGAQAVPNQRYGVFIRDGSKQHLLEDNLIRGNGQGGLIIDRDGGALPTSNTVRANQIISNTGLGVYVEGCGQNTLTQNSIYGNTAGGISAACLAAPTLITVSLGATETVTGTALPGSSVEIFSSADAQGQVYEGSTTADGTGQFVFARPGGFTLPNVTATTADASGNTSAFSGPEHLLWTVLLYLNGDNDLEGVMRDTLGNLALAGPSPRANVLALLDVLTPTQGYSKTILYDLTQGTLVPVSAALGVTSTVPGDLDMGSGQTLVDFATWGRVHYPARHTLLSVVDHGGGWAPAPLTEESPGQPALVRPHHYQAGGSGLSWDFSSNYDYLESTEMRQALATITSGGADKLDVVFYDVCLMGMVEVAYQVKDYASYFVSSQNIGWAPDGPQGRYVRLVQGIAPDTDARQMAALLVDAYAAATPPEAHPFTLSAVDLSKVGDVAAKVDQLGLAISQTLASPGGTLALHQVYTASQKLDFDGDFKIDPATDGFVDLYDFALKAALSYADPGVVSAAQALNASLQSAVVAEAHRSGSPWMLPDRTWDLDQVHGLSIFLPLGEDLELPVPVTATSPITPGLVITRNLRLRDIYTADQLEFVRNTHWAQLINTYYDIVASQVPTDTPPGPQSGLLPPDVTPPDTLITYTGPLTVGHVVTVSWVTTDAQSGVGQVELLWRPAGQSWVTLTTSTAATGEWAFTWAQNGEQDLAACATDTAGNVEPLRPGLNTASLDIYLQRFLPLVKR